MYCPSCGSEQLQGLRYCNRCGANLAPSNDVSSARLGTMVWALSLSTALVTVGGLAMVFIFAIEFLGRSQSSNSPLLFLIFFLLIILVIAGLLVRQLSKLLGIYLKSGQNPAPKQNELSEASRAPLADPQGSEIGELEQTTRRLEPSRPKQDK